ncbi:MAG: tail fiber domain-containing protein [Ignavibacteriaceae bacterium]|nr:tail fiber domain-containing protein [Ignavibacteriaceae bacterium]
MLTQRAGQFISSGSNLTCIGYNAQPTSGSATNQITLGNSSVTSLRCAVTTITALSDARDKKNIKDLNLGIDFLMKLKPRQYNWDKREWYENNISDGSKMNEEPTAGFIAQELDEAQINANAEWLNLVLKDNPEKWEATPGNLLPIIVKAVQELKAENDELTIKNEQLASALVGLTIQNDELEIIEKDGELSKLNEEISFLKSKVENVLSIEKELTKIDSLKEELIQQIQEMKSIKSEYELKFSSLKN